LAASAVAKPVWAPLETGAAALRLASPRDAYSVRSEMFLAAIAAFTESGVSFQP